MHINLEVVGAQEYRSSMFMQNFCATEQRNTCAHRMRMVKRSYGAARHNTKALEDLYRGILGRYPSIQPLGSVFTRNLQSTYILKASSLKRRKRPFPPIRSFTPPHFPFTSVGAHAKRTRGSPVFLPEIRDSSPAELHAHRRFIATRVNARARNFSRERKQCRASERGK